MTEIKVYSNLPEILLYKDGQLVETQKGEKVFTFQLPITGKHSIEARSGVCSSVILVSKVDTPNPAYTLPGRQAVTNWFDTPIDPDYYSVSDKLAELQQNPEAGAIIGRMMAEGASSRGDVAEAVKDNPALQRMMGRMTLMSLLKQSGASKENIEQINRVLQTIKKEQ